MGIGRNAPCPCGSGKKYKKCCGDGEPAKPSPPPAPKFRFESGSYGGPGRSYFPAALCYRLVSAGRWREHFCLVNPSRPFPVEDEASGRAAADLDEAAQRKSAGGGDAGFAFSLREKGYIRLEHWRRAKD